MLYNRRAFVPSIAAVLVMAGALAHPAGAAVTDRSPSAPAPVQAAPAPAPAPAPEAKADSSSAKVTGFRSAQFGMTIDDVTKAIGKDFRIAGKDIQREQNPTERTNTLIIRVEDLQLGVGPAAVAYIFGYSSQRLFQVNVLWGGAVNPKVDATALVGGANALRNYFVSQNYQPTGLTLNAPVGDGSQVIVFRGVDAQGRMTLLTLSAPQKPAGATPAEGSAQDVPSLQLSYIEKPNQPDVFKIDKGF